MKKNITALLVTAACAFVAGCDGQKEFNAASSILQEKCREVGGELTIEIRGGALGSSAAMSCRHKLEKKQ